MHKDIKKSKEILIRVEVKEYKEHEYLDVRTMMLNDQDEWRYTKKGVTIGLDQVDELVEAIQEVMKAQK